MSNPNHISDLPDSHGPDDHPKTIDYHLGVICPGHVLVPDICPLTYLDMPICPDMMQAVTAQVTCLEVSTTNLFLARNC
jgi:hypothetical protein